MPPGEEEHGAEVALLLASPPWHQMEEYYSQLRASGHGPGLRVKPTERMGKGLFAERDFEPDEVVLMERPLVACQHSHNKGDAAVCSYCFRYVGSISFQIERKLEDLKKPSSCCEEEESPEGSVDEALELLRKDGFSLPYQDKFPLPEVVECRGGCPELYCSASCEQAAWDAYHVLLCDGVSQHKEELLLFKQFADETNDIFHVASQVIANVILRAKRIAKERGKCKDMDILLEAWKPFAMGHKRLWWEAVALPGDMLSSEESSFRNELKELAADSLSLLKAAIFDEEYAPLFSLNVYGSIIGMFELNNLDLVVESPVENYFLFIDELEPDVKKQAEHITRPLLDALGEKYASFCQGTGFFAYHSCINHSCVPNAKAFKRDEHQNGNAVIVATKKIAKGEEIFTSYIDEEDASYSERQSLLADYGFLCECPKCIKEKLN